MLWALLTVGAACAAAPAEIYFTAAVEIDDHGQVREIVIVDPRIDRRLKPMVETQIKGWRFKPATLNGAPAASRTHLRIGAELHEAGKDRLQLTLSYQGLGLGIKTYSPPRFPIELARDRVAAKVALEVRTDTTGKLLGTEIVHLQLQGGNDRHIAPLRASLAKAMEDWQFELESVGGIALPGRHVLAFTFQPVRKRKLEWQTVIGQGPFPFDDELRPIALENATGVEWLASE